MEIPLLIAGLTQSQAVVLRNAFIAQSQQGSVTSDQLAVINFDFLTGYTPDGTLLDQTQWATNDIALINSLETIPLNTNNPLDVTTPIPGQ